jgi:hypothetical protein
LSPKIEVAARDLYKQLSHPVRRNVVSLLNSKGAMSVTDILAELNLTPGNFYYHLRLLKGLVKQDENGLYALTKAGTLAQTKFIEGQDVSMASYPARTENRFLSSFCFTDFIDLLYDRTAYKLLPIPLMILEQLLYASSGILPRGFFIERAPPQSYVDILVGSAVSWILVLFICIGFLFMTRRPIRLAGLVGSYAVAQLPLLFFGLTAPILGLMLPAALVNLLFLGFQAWSLMIFGAGFSRSANLSIVVAALVTIVAAYANVAMVLLRLPLFA